MQTEYEVRIVRSDRKTVAMRVEGPNRLVVRAPRAMPGPEIDAFIRKHADWIDRHIRLAGSAGGFTEREIRGLADRARAVIPERVLFFARRMGVRVGRIAIRSQRTRWGSCSARRNLNFNCLLMLAPPEVLDYVIVHELCHLRQMNHSPKFWAEVGAVIPGYREHKKWLRDNQAALIGRLQPPENRLP